MAISEKSKQSIEFISCPHLTSDEDGWVSANFNSGVAVTLHSNKPDHVTKLLLCEICAASVRGVVLRDVVREAVNAHFSYTKFEGMK